MVYLDVNHALAPAAVAALPSLAQVYRAMCFPPWAGIANTWIPGYPSYTLPLGHPSNPALLPAVYMLGAWPRPGSVSRPPLSLLNTVRYSMWLYWRCVSECEEPR